MYDLSHFQCVTLMSLTCHLRLELHMSILVDNYPSQVQEGSRGPSHELNIMFYVVMGT